MKPNNNKCGVWFCKTEIECS